MSNTIESGSTDQYAEVKVWTTADGLPKTDITNSTSGLAIKYQVGNGTVGTLSPVSMSAGGSHADGGIYHVGNGRYKIGLSDATVSAVGKLTVWIELTDTDCAPAEIRVVGYDPDAARVGAAAAGDEMALVDDAITAAKLAQSAGEEIAAIVETYIINEGDATAVMQAIADKIAADWVAGDASPVAIASAVWAAANRTLTALPAAPADWINAASIAANALDGKGDWSTHDAAAVKTAIETVGSMLQKLFAMTEDDGGVQRFTTNALEQAPAGGGGGGDATEANQTAILAALSGKVIQVASTVTPGGTLTLYKGSDYRVRHNTHITLQVTDTGGALHTILTDTAQVSSIIFGAGTQRQANQIKGTVAIGDLSYASDVLSIKVEITKEQLADASESDDYTYHVKAIAPVQSGETDGDEVVRVEGDLKLKPRRAIAV